MLWVETGGARIQDFEELTVFVSQLNALGHCARVEQHAAPAGLSRNAQFEIAPYLAQGSPSPDDRVVVVAAQQIGDDALVGLRRLGQAPTQPAIAFGSFDSRQAIIAARARLSYVLGRDPEVIDLAAGAWAPAGLGLDCPVIGVGVHRPPAALPRVLLVEPDLQETGAAAALVALSLSRALELAVLVDGRTKQAWTTAHGTSIPFFHYGETLPVTLARHADVLVSFASLTGNYRLQSLVANLIVSGAALLDGSAGHGAASTSDAFIRGPIDLLGLGPFLTDEIAPNLEEISDQVRRSAAAARLTGRRFDALLQSEADKPALVARSRRPAQRDPQRARVIFAPTNGIGLGHAQRCTLLAAELDHGRVDPVFAVFPSCIRLVKAYGFDAMPLIARSALHAQTHENDLANYLRLRALAEAGTAGGLVFDGGYVFDSIYRTILENGLRGVWIRRGLWRAEQNNAISLDREKAFDRIVVPTEAFEELNTAYSLGRNVRTVGPVVQRVAFDARHRRDLRQTLSERFGLEFDHLIVSKLGAGAAADRAPQVQAICGMVERRRDVLHLVVVWPGATQEPSWFGWSRSRVVTTLHAGALALAADLCISAAGYNSFHEMLYAGLPAIFLPQEALFMDDQRARAQAARERGVAGLIEPHELMTLEREIVRFLDKGEGADVRRRLAALELPPPGNGAAARLIEEAVVGDAKIDGPDVADRAAGCGWPG